MTRHNAVSVTPSLVSKSRPAPRALSSLPAPQAPSGKKVDISTVASNYHIEVNPSDVGRDDYTIVRSLLKEVAQTQSLDTGAQKSFKVSWLRLDLSYLPSRPVPFGPCPPTAPIPRPVLSPPLPFRPLP